MNKELHYRYIISYLLIAIVLLVTLAYFDVPDLVDKLSFALTLSSLLLSILAIFYSIISSNKQDDQFLKIIEANGKLEGSVKDIQTASKAISDLALDIPEHFTKIDGKLADISFKYNSVSADGANGEYSPENRPYLNISVDDLTNMVAHLQFSGMVVLYAFVQSSFKGRPLEFDFIEELDEIDISYGIGILNGIETTGLLDFAIHKKCIISKYCADLLYKEYKNILEKIVSIVNDIEASRLRSLIEQIDKKYA